MRNPLHFYTELQRIRLTAAVIYDRGRAMDHNQEQLAEDLKPLHEQRSQLVAHAITHDLGGVICAIRQLQADAKAHLETLQFLQKKSEDCMEHAFNLKEALKKDLVERGRTEAMSGDFSVTLVDGEITIR